jgi:hypothetical protein
MKKYTVFYAWQSDAEQNYNRRLIRMARRQPMRLP